MLQLLSAEGNPGEQPGRGSPEQTQLHFLTQQALSSTGRLFYFGGSCGQKPQAATGLRCMRACVCVHTHGTPKRASQVAAATTDPSQKMAL